MPENVRALQHAVELGHSLAKTRHEPAHHRIVAVRQIMGVEHDLLHVAVAVANPHLVAKHARILGLGGLARRTPRSTRAVATAIRPSLDISRLVGRLQRAGLLRRGLSVALRQHQVQRLQQQRWSTLIHPLHHPQLRARDLHARCGGRIPQSCAPPPSAATGAHRSARHASSTCQVGPRS